MSDPQTFSPAFPLFFHLPLELQDQIWLYALPPSRTLRIDYIPHLPTGQYAKHKTPELYYSHPRNTQQQIPSALHVTRASRAYALTKLTLRFHCYWNLQTDIPYIQAKGCYKSAARFILQHLVESGSLEGFRNLACDVEILNRSVNSPDAVTCIRNLPLLQTLYLAYPSTGIWEDSETETPNSHSTKACFLDPENETDGSTKTQSETKVSLISKKLTMTMLEEDVLGYLEDEDWIALENEGARREKLHIKMIIWSSMVEKRELV